MAETKTVTAHVIEIRKIQVHESEGTVGDVLRELGLKKDEVVVIGSREAYLLVDDEVLREEWLQIIKRST